MGSGSEGFRVFVVCGFWSYRKGHFSFSPEPPYRALIEICGDMQTPH